MIHFVMSPPVSHHQLSPTNEMSDIEGMPSHSCIAKDEGGGGQPIILFTIYVLIVVAYRKASIAIGLTQFCIFW